MDDHQKEWTTIQSNTITELEGSKDCTLELVSQSVNDFAFLMQRGVWDVSTATVMWRNSHKKIHHDLSSVV